MQVRHKKTLLRLVCNAHMIETRRSKLALLGLSEKFKALRRIDGARCATCIFNLHCGPHTTHDVEIYSELDLCAEYGVQRLWRSLARLIMFLRLGKWLPYNNACALTTTSSELASVSELAP